MVDLLASLNDTDYFIENDTVDLIITSLVIQIYGQFIIEIPINILSN